MINVKRQGEAGVGGGRKEGRDGSVYLNFVLCVVVFITYCE